ncbi:hypothetical protein QQE94_08600 [Fervidobacterium pennivorans subsp. shakshaketiis]|uniref:hypothetical protein n=1 Tax=Fervidobacterium TaxID=2422 RepID=UPI00355BD505
MVKIGLKISRVGIIGTAPHRFLDITLVSEVENLRYFHFSSDNEAFQALLDVGLAWDDFTRKFSGRRFSWDTFYRNYASYLRPEKKLIDLLPTEMLRVVTHEISKSDMVWVGDNDFDSSFVFATLLGILGIPYVLTFKETRIYPNEFEFFALENAERIIVPHDGYLELLRKKYNKDFSEKIEYADVDWRSKVVYDFLEKQKVRKLSEMDNKIHVCILSGRVIWDKNETRSRGRYYYVDIIEELLKAGFTVHLHTKALIKSVNEPIFEKDNPYFKLKQRYQNSFFIEQPINLLKPEGYLELMKYDLGLLTSGAATEDPEFMEFEQYNIPNRYYEYLMAGVIPIAPEGTLKYMEKNYNNVIFFKHCKEIRDKLRNTCISTVPEKFFCDLIKVVVSSY